LQICGILVFKLHFSYTRNMIFVSSYCYYSFRIMSSGTMDLYRQLVGPLGRVFSPIARPLPTQDNTNTEKTREDVHASSGIRAHEHSY
jgi:hypothetical protein